MDFDEAHTMLSNLVLYAGRKEQPLSFPEMAAKLGYAEEAVFAMFDVLEKNGLLKPCGTGETISYALDVGFVEDVLQTLVAENKLTRHVVGGRPHYSQPA